MELVLRLTQNVFYTGQNITVPEAVMPYVTPGFAQLVSRCARWENMLECSVGGVFVSHMIGTRGCVLCCWCVIIRKLESARSCICRLFHYDLTLYICHIINSLEFMPPCTRFVTPQYKVED